MVASDVPAVGDLVVCADEEPLGTVEADEGTHLRVRRPYEQPPLVWIPKRIIAGRSDGVVRLIVNRDELHDGVIALPPARQREYGTLEALSLAIRRHRAAQRPASAGATAAS
jgi:hypothetical protein